MSSSGRPRYPDILTPRQWEVLELLREGLTNEQIADRLGISLDGAKSHVSEILGRLGLSSREEAAVWRPEERRPWWAAVPLPAWPLWAKAVGAAAVVAVVGGLALLAWAVIVTEGPDGEPESRDFAGLSVEEAYARVAEAVRRPGFILYSEVEFSTIGPDGEKLPFYTYRVWTDGAQNAIRVEFKLSPERDSYDLAEEGAFIVRDGSMYQPDDPGEALRFDYEDFCPGTDSAVLSALLQCNTLTLGEPDAAREPRVEWPSRYDGRETLALAFLVEASAGLEARTFRIHLDSGTLLPLATIVEAEVDGESAALVFEYENEFIPADSVAPDFLDPRSIGYGAENADALLDEIAREVPVYWLGTELEIPAGLCPSYAGDCSLVLARVDPRGESGAQGELWYETPQGVPGIFILLWRAEGWEGFMASASGELLTKPRCATRTEIALGDRRATVFVLPELLASSATPEPPVPYTPSTPPVPYATPTPDPEDPCAHRVLGTDPFLTLSKVIAVIDYGDVVVDVRADITGYHRSLGAVEAVLGSLRRR